MSRSLSRSLFALISAASLLGMSQACAESRLALVIGQSAYRSVAALTNPANDARAIAQALSDDGFEVTTASDLSAPQMREKFGERGDNAAVGRGLLAISASGGRSARDHFLRAGG